MPVYIHLALVGLDVCLDMSAYISVMDVVDDDPAAALGRDHTHVLSVDDTLYASSIVTAIWWQRSVPRSHVQDSRLRSSTWRSLSHKLLVYIVLSIQ